MNEQTFDCHFCGGNVTAKHVNIMRHWKGRYILIENVPAHVCDQCGERYYDAVTAEAMDKIMRTSESQLGIKREICVPVIEMPAVYPSPQQTHVAVRDKPSD